MGDLLSPLSAYADGARMSALLDAFRVAFGDEGGGRPVAVVRVPGRVNLIGEHIDYCGYGVHPMAIQQDVLVAVARARQDQRQGLRIKNRDRRQYNDFQLELDKPVEIAAGDVNWWNYFLCGVKGVLEESAKDTAATGMDCLVDGRIPPRAGLSSSSALVVGAALCTQWANRFDLSRRDLADLCARSERFIGTQGGGMDQAIELLAAAGSAKLIEFDPLRAQDVSLPAGAAFVVANSLAECNKAEGSDYNARVAECRMAAKILAKALNLTNWRELLRLGDVQKESKMSLEQMLSRLEEILHDEAYTRDEVRTVLGLSDAELAESCLRGNTRDLRVGFRLRQRARHVFSEAKRVHDFRDAALRGALVEMGGLMSDSHRSCALDYECSHPQLDKLVALAEQHGALGARLTGAGWGGCAVILSEDAKVDSLVAALKRDYFRDLEAAKGVDLDTVVFATQPGSGACIYEA